MRLVSVAYADAIKIIPGLPGPLDAANEGGVLAFVQNAYLFALAIAGLLAVASIAYGAVLYTLSRGNPTALADAWDRVVQAFVGVLLLVGAGAILSIANPGLTSLELPALARPEDGRYEAVNINIEVEGVARTIEQNQNSPKYRRVTGGRCETINAKQQEWCSPAKLDQYAAANNCTYKGKPWNGTFMSVVCRHESGGIAGQESGTDRCYNHGRNGRRGITFSSGLFQINIINEGSVFPGCAGTLAPYNRSQDSCGRLGPSLGTCTVACARTSAGDRYCPMRACGITNDAGYAECKKSMASPERNIAAACQRYRSQGYSAWKASANKVIKICQVKP